jgi:hypothetical protein
VNHSVATSRVKYSHISANEPEITTDFSSVNPKSAKKVLGLGDISNHHRDMVKVQDHLGNLVHLTLTGMITAFWMLVNEPPDELQFRTKLALHFWEMGLVAGLAGRLE